MRLCQRSFSVALLMSQPTCRTALAAAAVEGGREEIPQLPAASGDPNIPSIRLGETIRFEEWGPIILNTDGTTRRIANWDNLTEQEKKVTWRRISKRNEERRLVLLEEQQRKEAEAAAAQDNSDAAKEEPDL